MWVSSTCSTVAVVTSHHARQIMPEDKWRFDNCPEREMRHVFVVGLTAVANLHRCCQSRRVGCEAYPHLEHVQIVPVTGSGFLTQRGGKLDNFGDGAV